jgi:predicted Rossmann-fold nucleotide-binding protein
MVGSEFWGGCIDWIKNTLLENHKTISPADIDLFTIVDTEDEVMEELTQFYAKKPFSPNF